LGGAVGDAVVGVVGLGAVVAGGLVVGVVEEVVPPPRRAFRRLVVEVVLAGTPALAVVAWPVAAGRGAAAALNTPTVAATRSVPATRAADRGRGIGLARG
jgi:hypothetical protein